MHTNLLLAFIFLCTSATNTLTASVTIFHYRSDLSLQFLKHGMNSFIDKSKTKSDEDFLYAIDDIIDLAEKNGTLIPKFADNLANTLSSRIERIYRLEDKEIDLDMLLFGLAIIFAIFLFYCLLYFIGYKRRYRANQKKSDLIL